MKSWRTGEMSSRRRAGRGSFSPGAKTTRLEVFGSSTFGGRPTLTRNVGPLN
jgi:hypothetical protein